MIKKYVDSLADDKLVIFLFHGVITDDTTYQVRNYIRKHLNESFFDQLIAELAKTGTPVSMDEVVNISSGKMEAPVKPYAITFDDGFENNFSIAAPILEKHNTPATFYISTQLIDENEMSWIDKIEWCFEELDSFSIQLPGTSEKSLLSDAESKMDGLRQIRKYVKSNSDVNPDEVVGDIFQQLGLEVITDSSDPIDQKMSWEQVGKLAENPLFIVGGHTHTHTIMSYLSAEGLAEEVDTCLGLINQNCAFSPTHFSYPEGQENHYSPKVISYLKNKGIICSPTAIDGVNNLNTDPFELRRISVVDQ
ncbi:polysaccharide deacetylase family protein [Desulfovibrio sp. JC010]|uniref:polysaccharide deacetylase family protein n=1 Tax=Desulfovibrio sp. JC010 TaxID=2593641 RepID=UPI0013D5BC0D|nr:polysaccharide deacetylase family protein [Desulfovibrio sp. JC010]NDV27162.1 polysaccharide deacetylase family protein [Desulfovibrio sp. JC010]